MFSGIAWLRRQAGWARDGLLVAVGAVAVLGALAAYAFSRFRFKGRRVGMLFLLLICVPSIALLVLGPSPSASTFDHVAWIYAAYFAVAWLLLLGVIIRPDHVSRPMLVLVTAIALATQVPLAVTLEADLHADTAGLGPSIWSVGLPEELAKAIPVLAVAVIYRLGGRHELTPKDYLVLGAVKELPDQANPAPYEALTRLCRGYGNASVRRAYAD